MSDRVEVIDDVEARAVLAPGRLEVVDGGRVHQHVEAERGVVPAEASASITRRGHDGRVVAPKIVGLQHASAQPLGYPRKNRLSALGLASFPARAAPGR